MSGRRESFLMKMLANARSRPLQTSTIRRRESFLMKMLADARGRPLRIDELGHRGGGLFFRLEAEEICGADGDALGIGEVDAFGVEADFHFPAEAAAAAEDELGGLAEH